MGKRIVHVEFPAAEGDRGEGGEAEDKEPIPNIGWYARCRDTEGNAFSLYQSDENAA